MDTLFAFIIASTVLALSPGPDNIYVLVQSISNGKLFGMATVCGLVFGCIIHTSFLAFGVSAIIKDNEFLYKILKILGALYLLFLAYKVYTSNSNEVNENEVTKTSAVQLFKRGFLMNVLNPKVMIFFLAFFPGFLFSQTLSTELQFFILGGIFMLISFIVFTTIVWLSASIKPLLVKDSKTQHIFKWLQLFVFVGIAIYILI